MNVKKKIKTVQNLSRKNFTTLMFIKEMHTCTSTVILGVLKNEKESWQRDGEEPLGREMVLWRTPRLREPGWGGANWKAEEAEGLGERAGMIEMRPKVGRARPSGTS